MRTRNKTVLKYQFGATFQQAAIQQSDVGKVFLRAFVPYDHLNGPEPRYFQQILENSLEKHQVQQFCEDFMNLLKYNQKSHTSWTWIPQAVHYKRFYVMRLAKCTPTMFPRHPVKTATCHLFQTPTDTELGESSQQAEKATTQQPPFEGQRNSDDKDLMFVMPVPHTLVNKPPSYEPSSEPFYMITPPFTPSGEASKDEEKEMFVTPKTPSYTPRTKRPLKQPRFSQSQLFKRQTKVTRYFGSQKRPKE
ncbi:hypothetical protein ACROYT_G015621 [Oculina patagonica]